MRNRLVTLWKDNGLEVRFPVSQSFKSNNARSPRIRFKTVFAVQTTRTSYWSVNCCGRHSLQIGIVNIEHYWTRTLRTLELRLSNWPALGKTLSQEPLIWASSRCSLTGSLPLLQEQFARICRTMSENAAEPCWSRFKQQLVSFCPTQGDKSRKFWLQSPKFAFKKLT